MYKRYTTEDINEFDAAGELYVCQQCDYHGHVDDFGLKCPACGADLEDDAESSAPHA